MTVRVADYDDINSLVELMRNYAGSSGHPEFQTNQNETYVRKLLGMIINRCGKIWIAESDGKSVGMLIAFYNKNIWNPDMISLNELAWWVEPEYRNRTHGYRLVNAYKKFANELVKIKKIDYWTLSKMSASPDLDYSKLDLIKTEETYKCQHS